MNESPHPAHVMRERWELVQAARVFLMQHAEGLRPGATAEQLELLRRICHYGHVSSGAPVVSREARRKRDDCPPLPPEIEALVEQRFDAFEEFMDLEELDNLSDEDLQRREELGRVFQEIEAQANELVDAAAAQLAAEG